MKKVLIHFVNVGNATIMADSKKVKKKLLCENINESAYFNTITDNYLSNFEKQAPENYNNSNHIVLPNFDYNYIRDIEVIPPNDGNGKDLLSIQMKNFTNENWDSFYEKYISFIFSTNDKEFLGNYEILLRETDEPHSRVSTLPKFNNQINKL